LKRYVRQKSSETPTNKSQDTPEEVTSKNISAALDFNSPARSSKKNIDDYGGPAPRKSKIRNQLDDDDSEITPRKSKPEKNLFPIDDYGSPPPVSKKKTGKQLSSWMSSQGADMNDINDTGTEDLTFVRSRAR